MNLLPEGVGRRGCAGLVSMLAGLWPALALAAPGASTPAAPADTVQYLSEFSGSGRLLFFTNQRDEFQRERFVTEGAMTLDFSFVSIAEKLSLRSRFTLLADMGSSVADNLPFSPKETAYDLTPYVEYQREALLCRFGWNHTCQHLIYKDDKSPWYADEDRPITPDVYYNRLFLGVGSRAIRPEIMRKTFFREGPDAALPHVLWYLEAGAYIRSLPGMDDESLTGGNDWTADLAAEVHVRLLAADRWVLFAKSRTQVLLDVDDDAYSRELVQLEAAFDAKGYGLSLLLGMHVLDEHPRDSKEGVLEIGIATFF